MGLIDVKSDLDNAFGWLESAGQNLLENLDDCDIKPYLNSHPEIKVFHDKIQAAYESLSTIWTPELLRQLRQEEEYQSDMEDRADAMNY